MADPRGFLEMERVSRPGARSARAHRDHHEIFLTLPAGELREQGARCMDCGMPFCHDGCPLGNLIPEWNDLVRRGEWRLAIDRLHATNNFPEFTGLICPAPCETACVLAINDDPVTIKGVEWGIIERGFEEGWVGQLPLSGRPGRSLWSAPGPAGMAAAEELNALGHRVVVYERDEGPGGLIRLGVPDFKLEKWIIDRRVELLAQAGIAFRYGVEVGAEGRRAARPPRRGGARDGRADRARASTARPRAGRHPQRDGVPRAAQPRRGRARGEDSPPPASTSS